MRLTLTVAALLLAIAPSARAIEVPADAFTADSFVAWAAARMTVKDITLTVYTAETVSRRCLNYLSGAHASESLTQEIVAAGGTFHLNERQLGALSECAEGEGYRFE